LIRRAKEAADARCDFGFHGFGIVAAVPAGGVDSSGGVRANAGDV
jgi:hypothetical protein